ncbi:MAG: caspase family protein [Anaerolineales bacterium]|nr:caspase family protein [Anaerolineales bacterium]
MSGKRSALIISNYRYKDKQLKQLEAPKHDARNLASILADPNIGKFTVQTLVNRDSSEITLAIEAFFAKQEPGDLALLYFSGHGIKDDKGRLYFASGDTQMGLLRATSIPATLVNEIMQESRSKKQILILDCCFSGAFSKGTYKAGEIIGSTVGTSEYLNGEGKIIMTATDAFQYAFEGDKREGENVQSVYSGTLIKGLETGNADLDADGFVTIDDLSKYVYVKVTEKLPKQRPQVWKMGMTGDFVIAHNPKPIGKLSNLPEEIVDGMSDSRSYVRRGVTSELGKYLEGEDRSKALAAYEALKKLTDDDSREVTSEAEKLLQNAPFKPSKDIPNENKIKINALEAISKVLRDDEAQPSHINFKQLKLLFSAYIKVGALQDEAAQLNEQEYQSLKQLSIYWASMLALLPLGILSILVWSFYSKAGNTAGSATVFGILAVIFGVWSIILWWGLVIDQAFTTILAILIFFLATLVSANVAVSGLFTAESEQLSTLIRLLTFISLSVLVILSQIPVIELELNYIATLGWGVSLGLTLGGVIGSAGGSAFEVALSVCIIIGGFETYRILSDSKMDNSSFLGLIVFLCIVFILFFFPVYLPTRQFSAGNIYGSVASIVAGYMFLVFAGSLIVYTGNYSKHVLEAIQNLFD